MTVARGRWSLAALALLASGAWAQDLEPRRWTHLPSGTHVLGVALGDDESDVSVDPVIMLEDTEVDSRVFAGSYVYAFGLAGRSARVDLRVPYVKSRWTGILSGAPARTDRSGFADPTVRLSVNLAGAPALAGKEYLEYRKANPVTTIVGAAVSLTLPVGEYDRDKLINLGHNRYTIRPQFGVVHTRGAWSYELTGSVFYFTDNNDFFGGQERERDPLYAVQGHVVRTFPNRWWVSAGVAYGWKGRSRVEGVIQDDDKADWLLGTSFGFPLSPTQGVKFGYLRRTTKNDIGVDSDSFLAAWSWRF